MRAGGCGLAGVCLLRSKTDKKGKEETMETEIRNLKDELQVYRTEEIAEVLGLHSETIRRWIRDGRLKAKKVGGQYFIGRSDIAEFVSRPPAP